MPMAAELIQTFATDVLRALGAPADTTACVAASLAGADRMGCHTHGTGLLPLYAKMIAAGALDPLAQPSVDFCSASLARVDGHDSFGQLTGALAVDIGIKHARDSGIAAVGICNGAHLGRLGEWAQMAVAGEMLFLAFCNTGGGARNVAPFGSHKRRLSTNPIAFGIPAFGAVSHDIIVDFATSQVAGAVIWEHFITDRPLDPEWATTASGDPAIDARDFIEGDAALLPLGGRVSGHKGYALAIIAEILGGIAGGMMAGEHDPEWFSNAALFLLIDPLKFLPRDDLSRRIGGLAAYLHDAGARLPGAGTYRKEEEMPEDGIRLPPHVCSALRQLADELHLELPAELAEITNAVGGSGPSKTW